jgi:hypothetical protein
LGYRESDTCQYSPPTCEKSGLELGLAQAAGPLGNLAARQADQPKELAWLAEKALPEEGISREDSEAAGAPGER